MMKRTILVASSALCLAGAVAMAQESEAPADPSPLDSIVGSWSNEKEGREEPSAIHITPISLEGADKAYYVEYTSADAINEVQQQEIWRTYQTPDGWRLRILGFHYEQYARIKYAGLWVDQGLLPDVNRVEVFPRFDMNITLQDDGFIAATAHRAPVYDGEAVEMEASLTATADGVEWDATKYAADGSVTWEPDGDEMAFHPYDAAVEVTRREDGLVIIDLRQGEGEGAENGDEVDVHYTGWNTNYQVFDSSRRPDRTSYKLTLPGQVIRGWQEGLLGIQPGTVRRLIIPGALGYGPQGRGQFIRPNETLHFEIECMGLTPAQAEVDD